MASIQTVSDLREAVSAGSNNLRSGWLVNRYRNLRNAQKRWQDFYDLNYDIKVYKNYQKIKLPLGRQMVDDFVSHLPLFNPIVEVIPFKETKPYLERAIKQQEFFTALLMSTAQQVENAIVGAAKDIGILGEAFWKVSYDTVAVEGLKPGDGESDEEFKTRKQEYLLNRMPIQLTARCPQNCYLPVFDHVDGRPVEIVEVYPVTAGQVRSLFRDWKSQKKGGDIVVFAECWNDKTVCFMADGIECQPGGFVENPYGLVPYAHAYSGLGQRTEEYKPETIAVGLIFKAEDIIKEQSRWHAYLDKGMSFAAMPIANAAGEKEDYDEGNGIKVEPGAVYYGGDEKKVTLTWAASNLPSGIFQALMYGESLLGKMQPAVLHGEAPQGVQSGYPMAVMVGQARLQFGIPLENLKTMVARGLELVRYVIRDYAKEDMPVWGESRAVTLSPKDCEGAYRIKVDFDATTPEEQANRALVGQRLRQGKSISHYTELKTYHNDKNPVKEISRMFAEDIVASPSMQQYITLKATEQVVGKQAALQVAGNMAEGDAGARRKAASSGTQVGGEQESQLPEDVLAQAMAKRTQASRGQP